MAFPLGGFLQRKAAFRVGRENLSVGAVHGITRIHRVESFADPPGERFPAPLEFRFASIA
jgi:hypothetical protein